MKRVLTVILALSPGAALAHAGPHSLGWGDTIRHAISQPDHALTLIAVLTLSVAILILVRRR